MLYQVLLIVGFIGLLVQAGLGALHGHDNHADHAGHTHTETHTHAETHTHIDSHDAADTATNLLAIFSPLRIFAFCLGMGATGLLLQHLLGGALLFLVAMTGGAGFYLAIVKPLFALVMRFASKPAETLTRSVGKDAIADSRFDATGRGIVTMTVDGQQVRLLATLDAPVEVKKGEKVVVVAVNGAAGTCQVTKL
jgi:membrane protein implicated in regulation of membrane protease activity